MPHPLIIDNADRSSMSPSQGVETEEYSFLSPTQWLFHCIHANCSRTFDQTNNLYDHIRDDHPECKMLHCPRCPNSFKCMATLVYHVRTHSGNKPYICPLPTCQFQTATKGNLKAHLLSKAHKDAMTLKLLNKILAMDTNNGRPEKALHAPRESKKRSLPHGHRFTFDAQPALKRHRSSNAAMDLGSGRGGRTSSMTNAVEFVPMSPVHGKVELFEFNPMSGSQPAGAFSPSFNNNINSGMIRSPTASLMHRWDGFSLVQSPTVTAVPVEGNEDDEDLTIRVKAGLLQSIEQRVNQKDVDILPVANLLFDDMDGTDGFGAKSMFMYSQPGSQSPKMMNLQDEETFDFMLPPLPF